MATIYLVKDGAPGVLFRSVDGRDEIFAAGVWARTRQVLEWRAGENTSLEQVSVARAREVAPAAFA